MFTVSFVCEDSDAKGRYRGDITVIPSIGMEVTCYLKFGDALEKSIGTVVEVGIDYIEEDISVYLENVEIL